MKRFLFLILAIAIYLIQGVIVWNIVYLIIDVETMTFEMIKIVKALSYSIPIGILCIYLFWNNEKKLNRTSYLNGINSSIPIIIYSLKIYGLVFFVILGIVFNIVNVIVLYYGLKERFNS